jgi:hypothetical protein
MNIQNIREYAINYVKTLMSTPFLFEGPPAPPLLLPSWNVEEVKIADLQLENNDIVCVKRINPLPTKTSFETYLVKIDEMKIRVDLRNNMIFSASMW